MKFWEAIQQAVEEGKSFDTPLIHMECVGGDIILHFKRLGSKTILGSDTMLADWKEDNNKSYRRLGVFDTFPV